jgi:hypothetical protein
MTKTRTVLVCMALLAAGAALRVLLWHPFGLSGPEPPDLRRRVSGVLHVHSVHSDGVGDVDEIAAAAKRARLDFVIITDHNDFDLKPQQRYLDGVLVIVATEISTRSGHILGLGVPEPTFRFTDDAAEVFEDVDHLGGVAMVAHPFSPETDFEWHGWDLPGSWGIELLNGDSQWRAAPWPAVIGSAINYPLDSSYALLNVLTLPDEARQRWDRLLAVRDVPMVVGSDAHGGVRFRGGVTIPVPSYEALFRLAQNHVLLDEPLTGDAARDAAAIVSSLRRGRGYVALDALAPGSGFVFTAESGSRRWEMGDTVPLSSAPVVRAGGQLPDGSILSLRRNGEVISRNEQAVSWPVTAPGVYRLEVSAPGWTMPWVVSNPIYVFDPAEQEARRRRGLMPVREVPPPKLIVENFESTSTFEPGSDISTVVDRNVIDVNGGAEGSRAARLSFELSSPTAKIPSPFAALVRVRPEDLSGSLGLTFLVRSDREYRVWVQVRDENTRSEDGTEWWYASVRSAPEWRRVAIPFQQFRTRDPASDGRLNLDKARGILFILDSGVAKPGTRGVIWIDDVGVY